MNPGLAVPTNPGRPLRGAFINTAEAKCSIFESGLMVYSCIRTSEEYSLDYFSLDIVDVAAFNATGTLRLVGDPAGSLGPYDFWVFNWHFVTMAVLDPSLIGKLPGYKFTIVLELQPDNPIGLVPPNVFDGYIALDPAARATETIFAFPRPLEGEPRSAQLAVREIPVIGSFGFGTPGKGFELLVEAVNREFDRAIVRVNIPTGTHVSETVRLHGTDYPRYLAALCERIAKPGIDVRFSYDFMTADQLIEWCADNDLNCFMYTRCQPGLAATTDQAVMSGRPLLTLSNDTFRHIHGYIPAYPAMTLREAIATTPGAVRRLQQAWSKAAFKAAFHDMLAAFGLVPAPVDAAVSRTLSVPAPPIVLVASEFGFEGGGILDYSTRLANALGRSGTTVERARCNGMAELRERVRAVQPEAVVTVGFEEEADSGALAAALEDVAGTKIVLTEPGVGSQRSSQLAGGLERMSREPIVPFYTVYAQLNPRPAIALIGFSADSSNLEELVRRIFGELPGADVLIEAPAADRERVAQRATAVLSEQGGRPGFKFSVASLRPNGDDVIAAIGTYHLAIFWHDPSRARELEDISSLAMITERAVAFSRRSPFICYGDSVTYVDDAPLPKLMALGTAAKIRTLHDFGEWQVAASIGKRLAAGVTGAGMQPDGTAILQSAVAIVASLGREAAAFGSGNGAPADGASVARESAESSSEAPANVAHIEPVAATAWGAGTSRGSYQRNDRKPRLVIASDRPFNTEDRRMRRSALLYAELGRTFDVVAVTRTLVGQPPALIQHAPGFTEHRLPRTNAESEWQAIALSRWGIEGGDDARWFDRAIGLNPPYMDALRSALDDAQLAVSVRPYAFGALRSLTELPIVYDALELAYTVREAASRTAPNRTELIEHVARIERECARDAIAIISGDAVTAKLTELLYGVDCPRVSTLPHIFDAGSNPPIGPVQRRARRAASGLQGDAPIALFVGSLTPANVRAASALIQIAANLPGLCFVIVGRVAEAVSSSLQNVQLRGHIDDGTLSTFLDIADVFVHPGVGPQGVVSRKLLDAVTHGVPLVITPEAAAGIFTDGHDADVAPVEAIPQRIADLFRDPIRRERQSVRARETLAARCSPAVAAASVTELFHKLAPFGVPA